jgi:hypothetical protein
MLDSKFLLAPYTVREQIYAALLTCEPSITTEKKKAPSSPIGKLLRLNRQIHDEVVRFMRSQLCVLIRTNNSSFIQDIVKDKKKRLPIISQLQSEDGTTHKDVSTAPVAMELEFYMFVNDLALSGSSAAFLLPASSIKPLLDMLWLPGWSIFCMQALLSFKLIDTYSYSQEKAEELLLQPWIHWFVPSHFVGISTNDAISDGLTKQLKKRLLGDYAATGHLRKLQTLLYSGSQSAIAKNWEEASLRLAMASKYARMVLECHSYRMREDSSGGGPGKDLLLHAWLMTSDAASNQVMCLLQAATSGEIGPEIAIGSGNMKYMAEARRVSEELITLLSRSSPYGHEQTQENEGAKLKIRKTKAHISFRAHLACRGLACLNDAVGYLEEAMKYEPETSEKLLKLIEELRAKGAAPRGEVVDTGVVNWESVAFQEEYLVPDSVHNFTRW